MFEVKLMKVNRGVEQCESMRINKRYIVDEHGNPKEVIILLKDFKKIEALLGLDLDNEAVRQLREARKDRESGKKTAYEDLNSVCKKKEAHNGYQFGDR